MDAPATTGYSYTENSEAAHPIRNIAIRLENFGMPTRVRRYKITRIRYSNIYM